MIKRPPIIESVDARAFLRELKAGRRNFNNLLFESCYEGTLMERKCEEAKLRKILRFLSRISKNLSLEELEKNRYNFSSSEFKSFEFKNAFLPFTNASYSNMSRVNLSGSNLREAKIISSDLSYSRFRGADLRGADLSRSDFSFADLRGADLRGARLIGITHNEAFKSEYEDPIKINFSGADLSGADLTGANLLGCDFSGANFEGANLHLVDLSESNLRRANLSHTNLTDADLNLTNLTDANLSYANVLNTLLIQANLYNARTDGVDFSKAITTGTEVGYNPSIEGEERFIKAFRELEEIIIEEIDLDKWVRVNNISDYLGINARREIIPKKTSVEMFDRIFSDSSLKGKRSKSVVEAWATYKKEEIGIRYISSYLVHDLITGAKKEVGEVVPDILRRWNNAVEKRDIGISLAYSNYIGGIARASRNNSEAESALTLLDKTFNILPEGEEKRTFLDYLVICSFESDKILYPKLKKIASSHYEYAKELESIRRFVL